MHTRNRNPLNLTIDDETRNILNDVSSVYKLSKSQVVDLLAQLMRDLTLDSALLPLVNKLRLKLGKSPLPDENMSYEDILKK